MKTLWKNSGKTASVLYFDDVKINETFRIKGGQGAVYNKCLIKGSSRRHFAGQKDEYGMYELATGIIYCPTPSQVELVKATTTIDVNKPTCLY